MKNETSFITRIFTHTRCRQEFLDRLVKQLHLVTGIECVGVRILNSDGTIPYESYTGFSLNYWQAENCLYIHSDQCLCTRAMTGQLLPTDESIMRDSGSLWSNDLQTYANSIPLEERNRYRGKCLEAGFQTLGIVVLRREETVLGLIQLADVRPGLLTEETMAFVDSLAPVIGAVILRFNAEEQLRTAKRRAEEANAAKNEFLANMSHEFRTPITIFMTAVEHLLQIDDDPQHRQLLQMADKAADRLHTLVENVLDYAQIESQRVELHVLTFVLRDCIEETLKGMRAKAAAKKLPLRLHIAPDVPRRIVGDCSRLGQILACLVDNAVKFTQEGEILVSVELSREKSLKFSVADTGIGVSADKRELIFDHFCQADSSLTRRYGGGGLGLAISRNLVERMGGEIGVLDREGKGSIFFFTLPLAVPADISGGVSMPGDASHLSSSPQGDSGSDPKRSGARDEAEIKAERSFADKRKGERAPASSAGDLRH